MLSVPIEADSRDRPRATVATVQDAGRLHIKYLALPVDRHADLRGPNSVLDGTGTAVTFVD